MSIVSFIFPFYNEEETLPLLIRRIQEVMSKEPEGYEMIFVNDDSKDDSTRVIAQEASHSKKGKIVLVNMSRRFGVEESFMAGLHVAQGDCAILMYTDMQDPPEVVSRMLQYYREGVEVVHTVRRRRIGEHPLKKVAAFFAYRIIGGMAEIKIPFDAGEFKLLSKNVVQHLLRMREMEPYLRGLIPWIGFKQTFVEYDMQPRAAGNKKVALFGKKAWTVFLSGIISFSDSLIYLILLTGLAGLAAALGLGILFLIYHRLGWFGPAEEFGLFLWATLMLALGILGLYLLKTYKNTRGRPHYIVKEVLRF